METLKLNIESIETQQTKKIVTTLWFDIIKQYSEQQNNQKGSRLKKLFTIIDQDLFVQRFMLLYEFSKDFNDYLKMKEPELCRDLYEIYHALYPQDVLPKFVKKKIPSFYFYEENQIDITSAPVYSIIRCGPFTWYLLEASYEDDDVILYNYVYNSCNPDFSEYGYASLNEIKGLLDKYEITTYYSTKQDAKSLSFYLNDLGKL